MKSQQTTDETNGTAGFRRFILIAACGFLAGAPTIGTAAPMPKSLCEVGQATALEFGTGGAVWVQQWGLSASPWFGCPPPPNIPVFDQQVIGLQETATTGAPQIDANLILRLPFAGDVSWVAVDEEDPEEIAGMITGHMTGSFVADLDAAHAVIDEFTITIQFGQPVHSEPDALIQVAETTGKFQTIQALGDWEWHVSGTVTIARVPDLAPQLNIFAALMNPALLLGAEEQVSLSGEYLRAPLAEAHP